jgi:3-methyladenine DNA glycosylase/8-oxoguanine DNA glycosylase
VKRLDLPFSWEFTLAPIAPYNFELTVHKPAGWSLFTPSEIYNDSMLWTAERLESGRLVGLKLWSKGTVERTRIRCQIFTRDRVGNDCRDASEKAISWALKTDEDLRDFYRIAEKDALVETLIKDLYGMHYTDRIDLFADLILAVTLQMAPIERSNQMMNLLIEQFGESVRFDGKQVALWPSPETMAKTSIKDLMEKCRLGYRAKILKDIAKTLCKGFPTMRELEAMPPEESRRKLMELNGIGEYSADIVSPHSGFPIDVWSVKIFSLLLFGKQPENPRKAIPEIKKLADERWGAWKGYVFVYVLNDLENLSKSYGFDLMEI